MMVVAGKLQFIQRVDYLAELRIHVTGGRVVTVNQMSRGLIGNWTLGGHPFIRTKLTRIGWREMRVLPWAWSLSWEVEMHGHRADPSISWSIKGQMGF